MVMALPVLYVLRHGETVWNAEGRLQGHLDSDLTERGMAQARAQRAILGRLDLAGFRAIASPQGRAVETARIALDGLGLDPETDAQLREIGLGGFAGRSRADVIAAHGLADPFDLYECAPGGEGFAALHRRCRAFLTGLEGPAILITHGITSRMLRAAALGYGPEPAVRMGGGQGVVYALVGGTQRRLTETS